MHACIGEGNGNPLLYSCLENPRDGGAWWAAGYGVARSWTRLKRLSSSSSSTDLDDLWFWSQKLNLGGSVIQQQVLELQPFCKFSALNLAVENYSLGWRRLVHLFPLHHALHHGMVSTAGVIVISVNKKSPKRLCQRLRNQTPPGLKLISNPFPFASSDFSLVQRIQLFDSAKLVCHSPILDSQSQQNDAQISCISSSSAYTWQKLLTHMILLVSRSQSTYPNILILSHQATLPPNQGLVPGGVL